LYDIALNSPRTRRADGAALVKDRVLEDRVEPLAHALHGLGHAVAPVAAGALVRLHVEQRGQQRRRLDRVDRRMPQLGRYVVLQAADPLRRVLGRAARLDHALVVVAGAAGQGPALALGGGLLRLFGGLGGLAVLLARIDRVDALAQLLARSVGCVARRHGRLAGGGHTAAVGRPQAHLAPAAAGRGVAQHPRRRVAANPQAQARPVHVIAQAFGDDLPGGQQMLTRGTSSSHFDTPSDLPSPTPSPTPSPNSSRERGAR
jgi:hypothetical protein